MNLNELNDRLLAAAEDRDLALCKEFLLQGADIHARTSIGKSTPLHMAAKKGNEDLCQLLIEHGADVHAVAPDGRTPLHVAALGGHVKAIQLLLKNGATPHAASELGRTPLYAAALAGHIEACRLLIENGSEVRALDNRKRTALHAAAEGGYADVCQLLIENGADPRAVSDTKDTPLHFAAAKGSVEVCRVLVAHGADVHPRSHPFTFSIQTSPASSTASVGDPAIGAAEHTPLQIAVICGKTDVVRYFFDECGEDIDQITPDGRTLAQLARDHFANELAAFLDVYRNVVKTERAVRDALSVGEPSATPSRSRGFSPL